MNPNQPLGLPEGTVRAVMALCVILTVCILTILGKPVNEVITGLAMAAFAAYHMTRGNTPPPSAVAPVVTVVPVPAPVSSGPPDEQPDPTMPSVLPA